MRRFLPWFAVLALAVPIAACKKEGETFGPATRRLQENVLHFGGGAEPESIDPGLAYDSPGFTISRNLFEGLTRYHPETLDPLPGVATSWEASEDGKTWLFHLRKDASWSNGRPVTAEDFVYAWRRVLDPATAAQYAALLWDIAGAKAFAEGRGKVEDVGVRALDPHTLEVRLERPIPWFLNLTSFGPFSPVPREAVEAFGLRWTRPEHIVTNGPFHLTKWVIGYEIELGRSPTYWGRDEVKLDKARAMISDDNHAMVRVFKAGQLDWLGSDVEPPQEYLSFLRGKKDFQLQEDLGTYFYWINLRQDAKPSPLHDKRVRQALNLAIDKDAIVRFVTRAGERVAGTLVPDLFVARGYVPPEVPGHDPERARALLAEAGYGPGGKPFPTIELIYNTHEKHRQVAEAIQQMWKKELGIPISIANQEWKVFMNNRTEGFFEIARAGWYGDFPDPYSFLSMFLSNSEMNEARWSNPTYDRLIDEALSHQDTKARYELYSQAEAILLDELPILPIFFYAKPTLIGPWVKGVYPNPQDLHPLRGVSLERH